MVGEAEVHSQEPGKEQADHLLAGAAGEQQPQAEEDHDQVSDAGQRREGPQCQDRRIGRGRPTERADEQG